MPPTASRVIGLGHDGVSNPYHPWCDRRRGRWTPRRFALGSYSGPYLLLLFTSWVRQVRGLSWAAPWLGFLGLDGAG